MWVPETARAMNGPERATLGRELLNDTLPRRIVIGTCAFGARAFFQRPYCYLWSDVWDTLISVSPAGSDYAFRLNFSPRHPLLAGKIRPPGSVSEPTVSVGTLTLTQESLLNPDTLAAGIAPVTGYRIPILL
ncbi:MAG: hypothetical protein COV95_01885 [Candidatus Zambryskibacteria bacterium CG11_big_fil_rev_8_21_14_0_20_40_24]|uniref:Uncharacterized protein n=1 Tax=Candidatus Zambryskibacteria bacterium CG11_big_fil_rev_8_21_14_0_20_40_24 TaxID=1975116 RepID=A0A2H0K6J7_9BACT|nr:MAG: hypothetical protein COV95_01885 [Candidatus Zambryskibacteria bacterium CG11_big_fil_rev_8_21_14_0_20_40_24]